MSELKPGSPFLDDVWNLINHTLPETKIQQAHFRFEQELGKLAPSEYPDPLPIHVIPPNVWREQLEKLLAESWKIYSGAWKDQTNKNSADPLFAKAFFKNTVKETILREWRTQRDGFNNLAVRRSLPSNVRQDYLHEGASVIDCW
jgi:hypothetical protein